MSNYLPLLPILIMLLAVGIMVGVQFIRPRFAYRWLIAAVGSLITWPVVLYLRRLIPMRFAVIFWEPDNIFQVSPFLVLDDISWAFALALAGLLLAVILTDVVRATQEDLATWTGSLLFAALGMLSVMAGNPLAMVLSWTSLDIVEFVILLGRIRPSVAREMVVISFATRVGGTLLLVVAMVFTNLQNGQLNFDSFSPGINMLLILAAGLRLGVFPPHPPFLEDHPRRRSLGTVLRFVPAAAGNVLLVRVAAAGIPVEWMGLSLWLLGVTALLLSLSWIFARDELDGRAHWITGMTVLVMAASILQQPQAALAWSMALLLPGVVLPLMAQRTRPVLGIGFAALLGVVGLPYTPASAGMAIFGMPLRLPILLLILSQSFFLLGMLKHILRTSISPAPGERWVALIYPLGLSIPLVSHWLIAWINGMFLLPNRFWSWAGLIVVFLATIFAWLFRSPIITPVMRALISRIGMRMAYFVSFRWAYRSLWTSYRWMGRGIRFVSELLEGQGGVLWALLWIVLIVTLISQLM